MDKYFGRAHLGRLAAFAAAIVAIACGDAQTRGAGSAATLGLASLGDDAGEPGEGGSDAATDAASGGSDAADPSADDDTVFDLGQGPDVGSDCGGRLGEEFSHIWIANSVQGTVSKIDTRTGVELGRYAVAPFLGNPSRTSVNLQGDVAVSSRIPAGVTKVAAAVTDCVDQDGDGVITTSTGATDVKAWGEDECVLWHIDVPALSHETGVRPTAWEGITDEDADDCEAPNPRLWIGWRDAASTAQFWRLDGDSGGVLDQVAVPNWGYSGFAGDYGPYGGAVNADGDLWASGVGLADVVHIDGVTLDVTRYPNPGETFYGMALDAEGNPWLTSWDGARLSTLDATTGSFTFVAGQGGRARGFAIDREGRGWAAGNNPCRLVVVDIATATVSNASIPLAGCDEPVGVSIDVDGFVWVVDKEAHAAFKVDPDSHAIDRVVTGLLAPYTYSDMTGSGLDLVIHPPG